MFDYDLREVSLKSFSYQLISWLFLFAQSLCAHYEIVDYQEVGSEFKPTSTSLFVICPLDCLLSDQ